LLIKMKAGHAGPGMPYHGGLRRCLHASQSLLFVLPETSIRICRVTTLNRPRATPAAALAALLCNACAVGPDFRRPAVPAPDRYTVEPLPAQTAEAAAAGGAAQTFAAGAPVPAQWWTLYRSEPLNALIAEAFRASPNLQSAQAALRQAHENVLAAWGVLAPSVDAGANGERQRVSGAQFGPTGRAALFNVYNASVSVSYGLDLAGGARRELEALRAQREFQRFALDAAYVTLSANVVTTAVAEASLRAQISATEELVNASSRRLEVVRHQQALGGASAADVLAQEAQLAQDRSALPGLRNQLDRQRSLLATLLGRLPSDQPAATFRLEDLQLPESLPVSLPSELVNQRPDVRQQEQLLRQASANIGVATANMLPQITLSGSYGGNSTTSAALFDNTSRVWNLSAGLSAPLFHGGRLRHQRRAALAAYDAAAAQYRETVLSAFRNVADSLRALTADAESLSAHSAAERAAAASLRLADRQYAVGAQSYLTLLNAQRAEQQARIQLIQAQAARYADTAALFAALGGGWWQRDAGSESGSGRVN
jgi:NodT family efflux transporter outer membrane factor (OMF) lipoprotein